MKVYAVRATAWQTWPFAIQLITGEGSHQLTANDIGSMGRFGANVIVFVLNNDGCAAEYRQ